MSKPRDPKPWSASVVGPWAAKPLSYWGPDVYWNPRPEYEQDRSKY
jgi:hypothetical protein